MKQTFSFFTKHTITQADANKPLIVIPASSFEQYMIEIRTIDNNAKDFQIINVSENYEIMSITNINGKILKINNEEFGFPEFIFVFTLQAGTYSISINTITRAIL